jgi:hypothetical protein
MANQTSPLVEQRVVAFALGHPGLGPSRIAAWVGPAEMGAIRLSTNGVWRVLRRHGLSTRAKRFGLVCGYAAPPALEPPQPPPQRHLDVERPRAAGYLIPKQTSLRLDLERYLRYDNTERAHTGRWTHGRTPDEVLGKAKLWQKR